MIRSDRYIALVLSQKQNKKMKKNMVEKENKDLTITKPKERREKEKELIEALCPLLPLSPFSNVSRNPSYLRLTFPFSASISLQFS